MSFVVHRMLRNLAPVALLALLSACGGASPEDALRAEVDALEQAMQARDAGDLKALLAEDFIGNDGLDREGAARLAQGAFLRYRDVQVALGPREVELHGADRATVRFTAALTGRAGDGLLPDSGRVYAVESGWRLEDGDWTLASVRWE